MNLVDFVSGIVQSTMPLVSGGSVVFTAPSAEARPVAPGGTLTPVVHGAHIVGATSVTIRNDDGDGLAASVPAGSVATLDGAPYACTGGSVKVNILTLRLSSPLTADLADGDPVSFASMTFSVTSSSTLSKMSYPVDESVDISWAFQVARDDLSVVPQADWYVTRTLSSGEVLKGAVVDVDAPDAVVLVFVGVRK